ncbi:MAG TPA: helix-turn-helix transcriptional regulator [Acidimicrobiales bacterium]|nr:helix-turn-helix transcriptional regulator [Acidimicrobiales bacterium]
MPDAADLTEAFAGAVAELEDRGYTREQIAERLGVKAPTLSRYVTGKAGVQVEHLPIIDTLLGERLGYVLRLAGFVDPETDTRTTLRTDRGLEPDQRGILVKIYDGFLELLASRSGGS